MQYREGHLDAHKPDAPFLLPFLINMFSFNILPLRLPRLLGAQSDTTHAKDVTLKSKGECGVEVCTAELI